MSLETDREGYQPLLHSENLKYLSLHFGSTLAKISNLMVLLLLLSLLPCSFSHDLVAATGS